MIFTIGSRKNLGSANLIHPRWHGLIGQGWASYCTACERPSIRQIRKRSFKGGCDLSELEIVPAHSRGSAALLLTQLVTVHPWRAACFMFREALKRGMRAALPPMFIVVMKR